MGMFIYGVIAMLSYSTYTRALLHESELVASRAEALAATAKMDAIRARLHPHFLFNALHTLAALSKFQPQVAESAFERLGDLLRYALRDDDRRLVEFFEEFTFTQHYLAFEQLRYEDRLRVTYEIDPNSDRFDVPPFSLQILAENAVQHAISVRPEGGSVSIKSESFNDKLRVTVADDGPGLWQSDSDDSEGIHGGAKSTQFGLRALRERLENSFGKASRLETKDRPDGFIAYFEVPTPSLAEEESRDHDI